VTSLETWHRLDPGPPFARLLDEGISSECITRMMRSQEQKSQPPSGGWLLARFRPRSPNKPTQTGVVPFGNFACTSSSRNSYSILTRLYRVNPWQSVKELTTRRRSCQTGKALNQFDIKTPTNIIGCCSQPRAFGPLAHTGGETGYNSLNLLAAN
jgi:hypothetical protein